MTELQADVFFACGTMRKDMPPLRSGNVIGNRDGKGRCDTVYTHKQNTWCVYM